METNEFLYDLKTPETTWKGCVRHNYSTGDLSTEAGRITPPVGPHGLYWCMDSVMHKVPDAIRDSWEQPHYHVRGYETFFCDSGKLYLDECVVDILPDKAPSSPSDNLKALRVRDLLTMTAGLKAGGGFDGGDALLEIEIHIREEGGPGGGHLPDGQFVAAADVFALQIVLEGPDILLQPLLQGTVVGVAAHQGHGLRRRRPDFCGNVYLGHVDRAPALLHGGDGGVGGVGPGSDPLY